METNNSRKTALIVVVIFIAFALGFYWLGKDNNTLSTQAEAEVQSSSLEAPLSVAQIEALSDIEKDMPVIKTIKKISPDVYQAIENIVRDYDPSNELLSRHMFDQIVGSVMKLVTERIPYASDESIINFTSKVNDYLNVLLEADPSGKTCFYSLFPYLRDSAAIMPPQKSHSVLLKQLEATNELLISSEAGVKQPTLSNEEKNTILTNIQAKLTAKYGKKTSLLGDLEKAKQQPAVTCRITMSFYDHILAMPDSQKKAAFLRSLFAGTNQ